MSSTFQTRRYREIRRLGAGGMATVTLAEDTVLGRRVALKRVHASTDARDTLRLKREAMVGASLNHPNLVFVYDAEIQADGDVMIVMEYVPGHSLSERIRAKGALPYPEALRILRGVAAALDAIHQRGIVHRDVKPANVLLGAEGVVKLADLGVAVVADRTRITTSGAIVGSFRYMAPEQLEGAEATPKVDIYALAAVAYELLSGEKARTESNPLTLARAIANEAPPDLRQRLPQAPAPAAAVLQRGMSADPALRPTTAGELVDRLERAFEPEQSTESSLAVAPKVSFAPEPKAGRSRRPTLPPAALAAIVALVGAAVAIALLSSGGRGSSSRQGNPRLSAGGSQSSQASHVGSTTKAATAASRSSRSTQIGSPVRAEAPTAAAVTSSASSPGASGASATTPSTLVERFYEAAAQHQYGAAWTLADQNLRNELGGYAGFESEMSTVRSITFQRAQIVNESSDSATIALQTTSVRTSGTQHCSATARTVRSGGSWLLDAVSVNCS